MATKFRQREDELHIEDGDFDRVRHIFPPPHVKAHCGSTDRTEYRGEWYRGQVGPSICVVCEEIERAQTSRR